MFCPVSKYTDHAFPMKVKQIFIFVFLILYTFSYNKKLRYKEDFYRLYYLRQNYRTLDLNRNLFWLNIAIYARFAPAWKALVYCDTEREYERYKLLLKMHLNYLMARNELYLGAKYDKHKPVFYTKVFNEDILNSLKIAKQHYKSALSYWEWVLKYKNQAETEYPDERIDLNFIEDTIYNINSGDLDLERTANRKLSNIIKTEHYYQNP